MRILSLIIGGLATLLAASPALASWQRAESRHFVIYADDSADHVRQFATQLERLDTAMRLVFAVDDANANPARRVTIFVVADEGDVRRLFGKGGGNIAGYYKARGKGAVAFVPKDRNAPLGFNGRQVLVHEYAHHFMFEHWAETPFPAWYVEGFAEFCATAAFGKDGSVAIGDVPVYRGPALLNPSLSMRDMLSAKTTNLPGNQRGTLYARGWLLTHYLLTQPANRQRYAAFVDALNSGKGPLDAATSAFGDPEALNRELRSYAAQQVVGFVVPGNRIAIDPVEVTELSAGAAAIMPALIATENGARDQAAEIAAQARALAAPYPDDPAVLNELAEAEYDAGDYTAAQTAAEKAAALDPTSTHARIYEGLAQMRLARSGAAPDQAALAAARAQFTAAIAIDPNCAQALRLYFESYLGLGQAPPRDAGDALLRAYRLTPFDLSLRLTAAHVLLNRGEVGRGRAVLMTVAGDPHATGLAAVAQRAIDALDSGGPQAALAAFSAVGPGAEKAAAGK